MHVSSGKKRRHAIKIDTTYPRNTVIETTTGAFIETSSGVRKGTQEGRRKAGWGES